MITHKIFDEIREKIDETLNQNTDTGKHLWLELIKAHPADIAEFLENISESDAQRVFIKFPEILRHATFKYFSSSMKVFALSFLNDSDRSQLLNSLSIDELTDFFDDLSAEELKDYLRFLHRKDRDRVISLLKFDPESAGGIMDTNVVTLIQDFTVEKSIQILQRLQPSRELHQEIYVTNQDTELVGHIKLEDLVLKHPKERLISILRKNELVVDADEDRESVAQKMRHYHLMTVPVVDKENLFLGVIPSDTLVDIIEEEAAEDVYRISALASIKDTYFETPFFKLFFQRSSILLVLLMLQSFSSMLIKSYEAILVGFNLFLFSNMLISTGGNTSSQTSALVIQGISSGEIGDANKRRFLVREFSMAFLIALVLGAFAFIRAYYTYHKLWESIVVSCSLSVIVMTSVILGSCIPLILKKFDFYRHYQPGHFWQHLWM